MGTRTRILAAAVAVLALAVAVPALAQDEPTTVALAYVDTEIDGPMATTLARLDRHHGNPTESRPLHEVWFSVQDADTAPDCVVIVGRNGDTWADWMENTAESDETRIVSAMGDTRHHTAELAADELVACRS